MSHDIVRDVREYLKQLDLWAFRGTAYQIFVSLWAHNSFATHILFNTHIIYTTGGGRYYRAYNRPFIHFIFDKHVEVPLIYVLKTNKIQPELTIVLLSAFDEMCKHFYKPGDRF